MQLAFSLAVAEQMRVLPPSQPFFWNFGGAPKNIAHLNRHKGWHSEKEFPLMTSGVSFLCPIEMGYTKGRIKRHVVKK